MGQNSERAMMLPAVVVTLFTWGDPPKIGSDERTRLPVPDTTGVKVMFAAVVGLVTAAPR